MENTSYVALSRQTALWRQMEVVANNMANANTPAYKTEEAMFRNFMVKSKSDNTPFGRQVAYVQDVGTLRDTREGPLLKTGEPLDIAVNDDGYFTVDTPSGERYTRAGHFKLDETGMVVNSAGYPVLQSTNQPIVVAPNESTIEIAGDGTISSENGVIGKLKVVRFDNQQQLRNVGEGLYDTTATPTPVKKISVTQGMLEDSNVQPVAEMTKMLTILRNYEHVQMVLQQEQDRQLKALPILSQSQKKS